MNRLNSTGPDDVDIMSTPAEFTQIFGTGDISTRRQVTQEIRIASPAAQKL